MAMSRRRGASSVTSASPIEIEPLETSSSPAIMRSSVDFPQPEGPTTHQAGGGPAPVAPPAADIAAVIDTVVDRLQAGGRLVYVGAGSSGRLAAVDASECESTFSAEPGQVLALLAGADAPSSLEQ